MQIPDGAQFKSLSPFEQLVAVMAALRAPDGCPWDRRQNHQSMANYLAEEAYEAIDAIEAGDDQALCEELGDVLFQVVCHAQMASERRAFDATDVCQAIVAKMVRRHPHVFGEERLTPEEVKDRWHQIKRAEKSEQKDLSILEGVPGSLPPLARARVILSKVSQVGFAWPNPEAALGKVEEELDEVRTALAADDRQALEEELGDMLFASAALAHRLGIDPEVALRRAQQKFTARFRRLESQVEDWQQENGASLAVRWNQVAAGGEQKA